MLAGVKFIPRDQIDKDENLNASAKQKQKKSSGKKQGKRRRERSSGYSSSDGEELERIKKGSKKRWYSSDEYSSSDSSGNESDESSDRDRRKRQNKKKKRSSNRKDYSSEDFSSASDSYSDKKDKRNKRSQKDGKKKSRDRSEKGMMDEDEDGGRGTSAVKDGEIVRKNIGLEWMLRPEGKERTPIIVEDQPKETPIEETNKVNPRELNPYFKGDGSGYPEDNDEPKAGADRLLPSSVVGDGGASWRLKAFKRSQEQAAREGQALHEVVRERWGPLAELAGSLRSNKAAPSRAHQHAIHSRKKMLNESQQPGSDNDMDKKDTSPPYLKDVSVRHPEMREPKVEGRLSWGKNKGQKSQYVSTKDSALVADAVSSINRFSNDGSFLSEHIHKQTDDSRNPANENAVETRKPSQASTTASKGELSANQLAAKAFQLRMKGKHEEAEELLQEVENLKAKQGGGENPMRPQNVVGTNRYSMQDMSLHQKKKEDDSDMHLAQKIMQNKKYTISGQADDEYDFDDGPSRKSKKKHGSDDRKVTQTKTFANRFSIQQERCLFCFENPKRPAHLVVAIGNYSYLMLPQQKPVVGGHCYILPMQHVPATRTLDDHVWEEIRNFKKCLIMMFAKQEKDVVFLETVMGLSQQRRHCIVECIPLPQDAAKDAPLYFKKAIDEAEDEWSQHNAKKLIDTSVKGLRGSVPANFPYFHVEFGLKKGFVHVIDDETQFNSNLGLNVIRGMLKLPAEDMHRRGRNETVEAQKQAVKRFDQDWRPFDWTKQLHES